jgi:hypothetical protein
MQSILDTAQMLPPVVQAFLVTLFIWGVMVGFAVMMLLDVALG